MCFYCWVWGLSVWPLALRMALARGLSDGTFVCVLLVLIITIVCITAIMIMISIMVISMRLFSIVIICSSIITIC